MSEDPAVLFYTSDFISGTALMSFEEKGQYIYLLCLQHQGGHFTKEDLLSVTKSEKVLAKFVLASDNKYHNERMHLEKMKRRSFCESRRISREKGILKQRTSNVRKTYVQRMENENGNEDININKDVSVSKQSKHEKTKDFLSTLKSNTAYAHIDIDRELAKMDAWLLTRPGRTKTKRFIVNWLNKIEVPFNTVKPEGNKYAGIGTTVQV